MYHSERFTRSSGAPAQRLFMVVALLLASLWMSVGVAGPEVASAAGSSTGASVVVSLTYDDGLNSQLDNAVPALDRHGFKATFFLTEDNIRQGRRLYFQARRFQA